MFTCQETILVVIDVQGKLADLMHEREELFRNIQILIQAAHILKIPVVYTEQVPEKLGKTIRDIKSFLQTIEPIEKISFSCYLNTRFQEELQKLNRKQMIVCGIETHVCIYQTVTDLVQNGFLVQVVQDAVSSRTLENKKAGLERMKSVGGELTSVEMVLCELLRTAEHKRFKDILSLIK